MYTKPGFFGIKDTKTRKIFCFFCADFVCIYSLFVVSSTLSLILDASVGQAFGPPSGHSGKVGR